MNVSIKRVVNKKILVKSIVLVLACTFAIKGVITVVDETITYTTNHLDSMAVERVESRHLINEEPKTVTVEVPVIKETSVADLLK